MGIEQVPRDARADFFARYEPTIRVSECVNGVWGPSRVLHSSPVEHPGVHPVVRRHLEDAKRLGFKLLLCPRIGGVRNPQIPFDWYEPYPKESAGSCRETFGKCVKAIEARGCGMAQIVEIGRRSARPGKHWSDGLKDDPADVATRKKVDRAVAEWSDGDTVAAHVAYGNRFFCTLDEGKKSGGRSILKGRDRDWATAEFGVEFVKPEELLGRVGMP